MPKYVPTVIHEFQYPYPKIPQNAPNKWESPNYGAKTQWAKYESLLYIIPEQRIKRIQKLVKNIYYSRAVDPTLLLALGSITAEQSKGTTKTEGTVHQFLEYCAAHPNTKL